MKHDQRVFSAVRAYRGDAADRIRRFLPMVRRLAWHMAGHGRLGVEVEDLIQTGLVALTECARRHDREGEDGFAAYAKMRVRGAMVDLIRGNSPDPRGLPQKRRRLAQVEQDLRGRLGREPASGEVADALGISGTEMARLRADTAGTRIESLDEHYSDGNAAFAAGGADALAMLIENEERELLAAAIAHLPERLQLVIQLYFVEQLNLAEISQILGVSIPRVHQLKAAALDRLRVEVAR